MKIKYLFISLSLIQCSNLICSERKSEQNKKLIEMEEGKIKAEATREDSLVTQENIRNTINQLHVSPETQHLIYNLIDRVFERINTNQNKNYLQACLLVVLVTLMVNVTLGIHST